MNSFIRIYKDYGRNSGGMKLGEISNVKILNDYNSGGRYG